MRKIVLFIVLLIPLISQAQSEWHCDEMGFIYRVSSDYVEKYSNGVLSDYRFSTLKYGSNAWLDLTNPLLPFLFFADQGTLVYLDNNLTMVEDPIFCNEIIAGQIEAMGGSRGDALWMFEANNSKLIKANKQLEILYSSNNLSLQLDKTIHAAQIIEQANRVILVDPQNGLLVFSLFGTYERLIPLFPTSYIRKSGDNLFFNEGDRYYRWNKSEEMPVFLGTCNDLILIKENNWIVKNNKLFMVNRDGSLQEFHVLENFKK